MKSTIFTYENHNLGDSLVFLHLLRALAKRHDHHFVHFCNGCHIAQLKEVVDDLPNIFLEPFESMVWTQHQHEAINVWKNAENAWVESPLRWDWSGYTLWHHGVIARKMGLQNPFTCREHLLFDYPALMSGPMTNQEYDFLIVNSEPCSGQFAAMAEHGSGYLDGLIEALFRAGKSITLTSPSVKMDQWAGIDEPRGEIFVLGGPERFTISEIGNLSLRCKHIIGVATGPLWPCMNVHNNHDHQDRKFIALLSNGEQLNFPHWGQCGSVEQVFEIARQEGWI